MGILRAKETQLQIAFGGEFFALSASDDVIGNGPALKLAALWMRWWGGFMIGGGTSFYYSFMTENQEPKDKLHQMTLNGEFMIGGGIFGKFAVYLRAEIAKWAPI